MNKLKKLVVALAPRIGLVALVIGLVMALCSGTASAAPVSVVQVAQAQVAKTTVVSAPTAAPAIQNVSVANGSSLSKTGAKYGNRLGQVLDLNPQYKANPAFVRAGAVIKVYTNGSAAPAPKTVAHTASTGNRKVSDETWDALAQCESSGNWSINTGNGFSGGLQFTPSTWKAFGGTGKAHNASRAEQIRVAENVLDAQGWKAWPSCSKKIGLR